MALVLAVFKFTSLTETVWRGTQRHFEMLIPDANIVSHLKPPLHFWWCVTECPKGPPLMMLAPKVNIEGRDRVPHMFCKK